MPPFLPPDRRLPSRPHQTTPIDAMPPQEFRPPGVVRTAGGATGHPPASRYDRARDLPRLLLMWPEEIDGDTFEGRTRVLKKLRRALRQERQRGIAGHWTYNLARHMALTRAYQHELARHTGAAARTSQTRVSNRPTGRSEPIETIRISGRRATPAAHPGQSGRR